MGGNSVDTNQSIVYAFAKREFLVMFTISENLVRNIWATSSTHCWIFFLMEISVVKLT
jgi:hypothetical protein